MKKDSSIHKTLASKSYLTPSDILANNRYRKQDKMKGQQILRGADTNWFQDDWSRDWGKDWGKDVWRRSIP